ncbi:hypothetical protein [Klebsiella michiganensis]|uniref:hypothetical protein n=1 Tax=Klebsiella michiganensis TaxID=1134687 RepID=UPI000A2D0CD7|nr:hypothetical protein [Klebsiella michiganensis]OSY92175.1 hypothetical protein BM280_18235 [Klebsiella michiganensis]
MTSKLTREENVQAVFDLKAGYTLGLADVEILKRVARMALAAMDSEPVADSEPVIVVGDDGGDALSYRRLIQSFEPGTKLYLHAQPAPVVLKDHQIRELVNQLRDIAIKYHAAGQLREQIARVVRAAMLQAGNSPVIPDGLIGAVNRLLDSDGSRGCYSAIRCGDALDEIERLLAAAPQEVKGE